MPLTFSCCMEIKSIILCWQHWHLLWHPWFSHHFPCGEAHTSLHCFISVNVLMERKSVISSACWLHCDNSKSHQQETKQLNKSSLKLSHQTYNMVKFSLSPLLSSRLKRVTFEPRFRVSGLGLGTGKILQVIIGDSTKCHVKHQTWQLHYVLVFNTHVTALQTATSLVFTNAYTNCNVRVCQALPCLNVKTTTRVVRSLNVRALTVVSQSRVRSSLG